MSVIPQTLRAVPRPLAYSRLHLTTNPGSAPGIELYGYTGDNRIHNENEIDRKILQLYIKIPIIKYSILFVENKKFTKHT